jgi:hypothetical protein
MRYIRVEDKKFTSSSPRMENASTTFEEARMRGCGEKRKAHWSHIN